MDPIERPNAGPDDVDIVERKTVTTRIPDPGSGGVTEMVSEPKRYKPQR